MDPWITLTEEQARFVAQQPLAMLPIAAVTLLLLAWRGCFSPRAFDAAPRRDIGLGLRDVIVAVALTAAGIVTFQIVALQLLGREGVARLDEAPAMTAVAMIVLGQLLVQLPPAVYLFWRAARARRGWLRIGLAPRRPIRDACLAIVAGVATLPIVLALLIIGTIAEALLHQPPDAFGHRLLVVLVSGDTPPAARLMLIGSVVLIGPVLEELLYRGLLQSAVVQLTGMRWMAIFAVSAVFAVMHLGAAAWYTLPGLMALSIAFGWTYERTGSLLPPILLHILFNAFNVTIAMYGGDAPPPEGPIVV
jgi:membrane protease YdiL (CAAX protease family)